MMKKTANGNYLDNIQDPRVRAVVDELPDACSCFWRNPRWDGHTVNPKCDTILVAERIIERLENL